MKASVYYGKGDIRIEKVPDPNLWFYRGEEPDWKAGFRTGHEWMGIVEEVGRDVRIIKKGDRVLAPFAVSGRERQVRPPTGGQTR